MKSHGLLGMFMLLVLFVNAQIQQGGEPFDWQNKSIDSQIPFLRTEPLNLQQLAAEDAVADQYKDAPYRFGVEYEVNIDLISQSTVFQNEKHTIYQYGIECPDALNISLRFDTFNLPAGGSMYIWSADRREFIGSFNSTNNKDGGVFATGLVHGDKVIVELHIPTAKAEQASVRLGQIVHGYRKFLQSFYADDMEERGPFGNSDPCEININCTVAADWQIQKRAVAVIVQGGFGICSGAMVNNTANDGTPYFLTANHCTAGSNVGNWIFYFNHESATCNGSTGPTNNSISGSEQKANNANSDFALLLLDETPPASWNIHYAGWDATDDEGSVNSAVCIHHPAGDVKKFSREDDAPYHDIGNGAQVWWIDDWEVGVTEGGSSGSPLFNQDKRIIGQLYGGTSGCNGSVGNGGFDFYGRFGVSWNGTAANRRLRDWLDPGNTGTLVLDGYPQSGVAIALDAGATVIAGVPAVNCGSQISPQVTLKNFGTTTLTSCTINYQINSGNLQTYNWTGSLAQNAQTVVNLPAINAANGNNTLTVSIANPNNGTDQNINNNQVQYTFSAFTGEVFDATVEIILDNYPQETSWQISNGSNVLYSGGTYGNLADGSTVTVPVCLPAGCFTFTIFDTADDGICCGYGNGSYQVLNQFGDVMADGGNFDDVESTQICLSPNSVEEYGTLSISIFPTPATENITFKSPGMIESLEIFDSTGKLVWSGKPNQFQFVINTSDWSEGVYMASVNGMLSGQNTRFIIQH